MASQPLVQAGFGMPERQNRWTVAFRLVLAFPLQVVLLVRALGAFVLIVAGWFAALVMGRLPRAVGRYLANYIVYVTRLGSYTSLMNSAYPPFSTKRDYGVNVDIPIGRVRRLAVLFRLFLLIPAGLVTSLASAGTALAGVFIWLIVLVAGRMPLSLFAATAAVLRFRVRYNTYAMMLTGKYPGELFGDQPVAPFGAPAPMAAAGPPAPVAPLPPVPLHPGATTPPAPPDAVPLSPPASPYATVPPFPAAPPSVEPPPGLMPPAEPPRTGRLVLSKAAKRIVATFLVLGGLSDVGIIAANATLAGSASAYSSLVSAHDALDKQIASAVAQRNSCSEGSVTCVDRYWGQLGPAFGSFRQAMATISFPAGGQGDAARLEVLAGELVSAMQQLAVNTSVVTTDQIGRVQSLADDFDSAYRQLVGDLL